MIENKLTIIVKKPVKEVFSFGINPINTPSWVDSIVHEEVDGMPLRAGSIYKNTNPEGVWSEYKVSQFIENKIFELSDVLSTYKVRYTFTPLSNKETELEYFEWMEVGELISPIEISTLIRLRDLIELT